jgi:hypothetical protein
LKRSVG